jgi:hypothetical protein
LLPLLEIAVHCRDPRRAPPLRAIGGFSLPPGLPLLPILPHQAAGVQNWSCTAREESLASPRHCLTFRSSRP